MSRQQSLQLYEQQNLKIARVLEDEKLKIQGTIAQQKNMAMIKNLQIVQSNQSRKCQFCEFQGVSQAVYYHTKLKHQKEFMEQNKQKDKYQQCEICQKILRTANLNKHQLICNMKKISKEKSKDANLIKRMKERQFQGCQIEMDEQNDFYQSLLGDLGIKDDQEESFDLKNSNFEHESNLSKQISDSEIFNTRKKQKKEEEKGEESKCKEICQLNSDENDLVENIDKFQIMSQQSQK
ncbi:hypothetical protein ABPG72_008344 [Tetrahymena utriculariae]